MKRILAAAILLFVLTGCSQGDMTTLAQEAWCTFSGFTAEVLEQNGNDIELLITVYDFDCEF